MTQYYNNVGPGYEAPPLAEPDGPVRDVPQPATTPPGEMIMGCTDPDADNFTADANSDDGSCTYPVVEDDTETSTDVVKTAGFMGLPKIAWIAIIGAGLYYAYSKGMLKKFMK